MARIAFTLFIIAVSLPLKVLKAESYPEVLFSNGGMPGNYGHSLVAYSGFSWVENVKGRVPLTDTLFFTPGNSLSLKYTSSIRGHWELSIYYPGGKGFHPDRFDDVLSFHIYPMEGFEERALPRVVLLQGDTCTAVVAVQKYLPDSIGFGQWLNVRIPLSDLSGMQNGMPVSGIRFLQGNPTGVDIVNHLLIDQVEFVPANPPLTELNYPAVLDQVVPGAQHVDLEWQLPLDPGIRYAKIYRSMDGENYVPVAIRPISASRYADFVPEKDRRYYYRLTWLDYGYNESPYSDALPVDVKPVGDSVLLESIQRAHMNYFDRYVEFNSGMHRVDLSEPDATVDVGGTGYSLLVQTVGVANGWIHRGRYMRRIQSVIDFLSDTAEQYHGMFPAYLDGRTGVGVYGQDSLSFVDLTATASLAQGLLVVRQYLDSSVRNDRNDRIGGLVGKIDRLWERMEWSFFALEDTTVLYDGWSPEAGFRYARPLGGFGKDLLTYLLALSAPRYALSADAYTEGLGFRRTQPEEEDTLVEEMEADLTRSTFFSIRTPSTELESALEQKLDAGLNVDQRIYEKTPYRVDTLLYGYYHEVGEIDRSLLDAYYPFLAFEPWGKRDTFTNYGETLVRLTEAYKRRDNEIDAGSSSPDIWGSAREPWSMEHLPTIVPAIPASSVAFVPEIGIRSIRELYHQYGKQIFTEYGFRDWLNIHEHKVAQTFNPFHQAIVPVMIENHRSGLIWDLFMQHADVARATERFFRVAK